MAQDEITAAIAAGVRTERQARGWSARELSDRLRAAGLDGWDRQIVANLENGRRGSVSVSELLVLAYVLAVPPVMLILPLGREDSVRITPKVTVHPHLALKWIEGDEPPMTSDRLGIDVATWNRNSWPLAAWRNLSETQEVAARACYEARAAEKLGRGGVRAARERRRAALEDWLQALTRLHEMGQRGLPAYGNQWRRDVEASGLRWPDWMPPTVDDEEES